MKKWILLCLTLLLLCGLTGCKYGAGPEFYQWAENWTTALGRSQRTADADLIGTRTPGDDDYTGSYQAECTHITGRDMVFGGASLQGRTLTVSGSVQALNGQATIRIRQNGDIPLLTPDATGSFSTTLFLENGGNYIMVIYEDFSGTVTLTVQNAAERL